MSFRCLRCQGLSDRVRFLAFFPLLNTLTHVRQLLNKSGQHSSQYVADAENAVKLIVFAFHFYGTLGEYTHTLFNNVSPSFLFISSLE